MRRRRMSFGKRVRREALKSAESKRHAVRGEVTLRDLSITDPVARTPLARVPIITAGDLIKNQRSGNSIVSTGMAIRMTFENLRETEDMVVRVIVGYKKYDRSSAEVDSIFMDKETEENQEIQEFPGYFQRTIASLDRKSFRKLRDFKFMLTAGAEDALGTDSKTIKVWVPLRNIPIKFEGASATGGVEQTLDPILYFMCWHKNGTAIAETPEECVRLSYESIFYFKDP